MLNKQQEKDASECENLQAEGDDMDCTECSCSICIAQLPTFDKMGELKQFISYAEREGVIKSDIANELIKFTKHYIDSIDA